MNPIQQAITRHLETNRTTIRAMAARSGVSYPILLAVCNKGSLPRNPVHREAIRKELGLANEAWARMVASCQVDGLDLAEGASPSFQQLVLTHLIGRGHSEQSFAKATGIPYQTMMGVTRRGAIPRNDTVQLIAKSLGIAAADVESAIAVSRGHRHGDEATAEDAAEEHPATPAPGPTPAPAPAAHLPAPGRAGSDAPPLPELIATAITRQELSIAAWSRQHGLPYLSLSRILSTGSLPSDQEVLEKLRGALGLSQERFAESLSAAADAPAPARPHQAQATATTPLQAALLKVVEERHLTTKAFADLAGLSALTAARLLRQGELPGRATTHEKLRTLLALGPVEYEHLVDRSRQALAVGGGTSGLAEAAEVAGPVESVETAELVELVGRLAPAQRLAAKRWLTNLLGG